MATAPQEYQRLSGRGRRIEGSGLIAASRTYCSVWMGRDHLLLADRTGYTETYKRFYFRDIEAVIIRKTMAALVGSLVLGLLALVFILLTIGVSGAVARWVLGSIAATFAFFTLLNLWFGPSCVTHIRTAVQTEQLPPWKRLRTARKGMARLRPKLVEAQGEFPVEQIKAELEERFLRPTRGTESTQL